MKKLLVILIPILCFTACEKPAQTDAPEDVVAQVGPLFITQQEFDAKTLEMDKDDQDFVKTPIGRGNFINLLVREKLALLSAKDSKIEQSDLYQTSLDQKRQQLDEIYQQYADDLLLQMWHNALKEQGLLNIADEEIAAYHKKYPYEMTVKQIIIGNAQTADQVFRALRGAPSRWNELEAQYSAAPEQIRKKEITFMPGEYLPEIETVAANSPTGSVQGFIKTAQGFHIIMKTREKRLSLKDASSRIRTILENQKIDAVLNGLQNKYEVVIYAKN